VARPRTFAEDRALDAAMQHFWRHGYTGTTVRDLGAAMGLGPASLYNSFGTKHDLFLRTLERYVNEGIKPRLAQFAAMADARAAIETFLEDTAERSLADPHRRGCLLVNTALEVAPHDTAIGTRVAAWLGEVEDFFTARVRDGQRQGRIPSHHDAAGLGRLFVTTVMGVRVLARGRPVPELLRGAVRQALAALDGPPTASLPSAEHEP
jgi:TetR/AcrR family transcriptional repressor of nem operon